MNLSGCTIENENTSLPAGSVSVYIGRRVYQVETVDIVISDLYLRVSAIERQRASKLWDGHVANARRDGQFVWRRGQGRVVRVTCYVEVGGVSKEGCRRYLGCAHVGRIREATRGGIEICRGRFDELSEKLRFRILLTKYGPVLLDSSTLVV